MLDDKYISFIKDEALNLFSKIYIIDVISDSVYECEVNDSSLISTNKLSFFDYAEKMKANIHPDNLKEYFDNITTNNISNNNGSVIFEVQVKNENEEYSKYINYATLLHGTEQVVMVASFKETFEDKASDDIKNLKERLSQISFKVSDIILKIYNTLDSAADNGNTAKYISILLDTLVRDFPEFNKQFEENMLSQINKTRNTLLIVDDDPMTRKLIQKTFSDDYEIIIATNGKEAIDILERAGIDNIVGIFLDLMMPVLDGFAVLDYLREKNILYKLPIIIISGTEDKKTRQRVYQYNIADLLEKPFNLEVIKYRTTNLIKLYRTSNALNNVIVSQNSDMAKVIDKIVESYKFDNKDHIKSVKKYLELILTNVKITYPEYKLNDYKIKKILEAVELYDIGFYVYPKTIDFYRNNTSYIEYPKISSIIISKYFSKYSDDDLYNFANNICLYYKENYDGKNSLFGIVGDNIPICAQCTSIAVNLNKLIDSGINNKEAMLNWFNSQQTKFNPKLLNILDVVIDNMNNF